MALGRSGPRTKTRGGSPPAGVPPTRWEVYLALRKRRLRAIHISLLWIALYALIAAALVALAFYAPSRGYRLQAGPIVFEPGAVAQPPSRAIGTLYRSSNKPGL